MADVPRDHSQPRFHQAEADPADRPSVGLAGERSRAAMDLPNGGRVSPKCTA